MKEIADVAHKAFLEWRKVPLPQRVRTMYEYRDRIAKNIDKIAETITHEAWLESEDCRGLSVGISYFGIGFWFWFWFRFWNWFGLELVLVSVLDWLRIVFGFFFCVYSLFSAAKVSSLTL
jgi:hypothetical protein